MNIIEAAKLSRYISLGLGRKTYTTSDNRNGERGSLVIDLAKNTKQQFISVEQALSNYWRLDIDGDYWREVPKKITKEQLRAAWTEVSGLPKDNWDPKFERFTELLKGLIDADV